jgi:hypothetical protein
MVGLTEEDYKAKTKSFHPLMNRQVLYLSIIAFLIKFMKSRYSILSFIIEPCSYYRTTLTIFNQS